MNNYPRLFAVYSSYSGEVVYTSVSKSACMEILRTINPQVRHVFDVVRYDPWDPSATHHWVEAQKEKVS